MSGDFAPWRGPWHKDGYGNNVMVNELESACPIIVQCARDWMTKSKRMHYKFLREFFHRDVGCFRYWEECEDLVRQGYTK